MSSPSSRRVRRESGAANPHLRALGDVLLAVVPLLFVVVLASSVLHGRFAALDFRHAYWSAGHRVLLGSDPYAWTLAQLHAGIGFVYPALSAVVFAPAALVSRSTGVVVLTLLGICVAPATLALLHVRDWRVYAVTLVWLPICAGWLTANESLVMAPGVAAVWRWRDRPLVAGFLTAAMLSLKPLVWPLAVWLLATRRWRASGWALASGLLLNALAWSIVGLDRFTGYLHAARVDAEYAWMRGFGVPALLGHLGGGREAGLVAMVVLSLLLAAALVHAAAARRDDLQALTLTVALALVSSPILWGHYFVLLLVPLAVLRPRLSWLWVLPIPMWVCPPDVRAHLWQILLFWLAGGLVLVELLRQRAGHPPAARALTWRRTARLYA